jgi:hypothetical protein
MFRILISIGLLAAGACAHVPTPEEHALGGPRLEEPTRSMTMAACMSMLAAPTTHCLCIEGYLAKGYPAQKAHEACLGNIKDKILSEMLKNGEQISED